MDVAHVCLEARSCIYIYIWPTFDRLLLTVKQKMLNFLMEFPGIVIKKFKFEFINYDEIENFNFPNEVSL